MCRKCTTYGRLPAGTSRDLAPPLVRPAFFLALAVFCLFSLIGCPPHCANLGHLQTQQHPGLHLFPGV